MIRGLKRGGIAPEEVTKAYLPDVSISTAPRLIASGLILPTSKDLVHLSFGSTSILGTKSPSLISGTTLLSAE